MEELKSYWQTPSIAHFCYLFRDGLKLPKFDYEELEFALLSNVPTAPLPSAETELNNCQPDVVEDNNLLLKLITILLRGYFRHSGIDQSNWEHYLRKLFELLWVGREERKSPFIVDVADNGKIESKIVSFNELPLKTKVEVLYHLCEYRLYAEDSQNLIAHLVEDELRLEPLAKDSKGNNYWYFYGTRLYKENPASVKTVEQKLVLLDKRFKRELDEKVSEQIQVIKMKKEEEKAKEKQPPASHKETPSKRARREYIPGERISVRERKPVNTLQLNGSAKATTSKRTPASKALKSAGKPVTKNEDEIQCDASTSCGVSLNDLKEAWTCICESQEDWERLADSFKKSKTACEVEFYKVIMYNFLPRITEIFTDASKKKALEEKKKLLEFLPRRLSSRVQLKKIQKEEDEKKEQEEQELRKRVSSQAGERARRDHEREEVKKAREERSKQRLEAMENRAVRAVTRGEDVMENSTSAERESVESIDNSDPQNAHLTNGDSNLLAPSHQATNGWLVNEHSYCIQMWSEARIVLKQMGNHRNNVAVSYQN